MQKPHTQGPLPSLRTGAGARARFSDEAVATALRTGDTADEDRPTAELLARHWQSVFDYASIGTPSAKAASMLTTAAFGKVLENLRQAPAAVALRPLLLMTARQIAMAWAADERVTALPDLQNPDTGRTVPVDMFTLAENRALVSRSFLALPGPAQCLLWHAEVEGEGISVPAGLLAIDPRSASAQLEQAREIFRAGVLRFHLELAPDPECRHYNRLLDVSTRRGGTLIPDIQTHLAGCRHCRFAVEQLDHGGGRSALLLAEGLLGQAAPPYLDSRPARNRARFQAIGPDSQPRRAGRHSRGGRTRATPTAVRGRRLSRRGRAAVVTGLGVVTGLLVVATVVTELWADDGAGSASPSPSASASNDPGAGGPGAPTPRPTATSADHPAGPFSTHLRNSEAGLCLDVRDRRAEPGAEAVMAACADTLTEEWTYDDDGLLHSAAAPELCLNSHQLDGILHLRPCGEATADATDVRYDLTVQGTLIPRWNDRLAVVPSSSGSGAPAVVKVRDGSREQRWETDNVAVGPKPGPSGNAPNTKEVNDSPKGTGAGQASAATPPRGGVSRTPGLVPSAQVSRPSGVQDISDRRDARALGAVPPGHPDGTDIG
ncbi:ricin-type beta-trefoil lectin domain protein [Streptomyces sp. NPDC004609]|uniref:RICIN domain-containing protein n=1 Tax=Streptomyces sp. NPDC004609 TaxID=3364704 RepID=UPI0036C4324B